ncbi:MAG: hypothetical protein ACOCUU_01095 [Nanoarchaeota archaeon]
MKEDEIPHILKIIWIIAGVILLVTFIGSSYLINYSNFYNRIVLISYLYIISVFLLIPYVLITIIHLISKSIENLRDKRETLSKYKKMN